MTPWTVAHQAPLSMGFSGKNTGVGCYFLLLKLFLRIKKILLPLTLIYTGPIRSMGFPGGAGSKEPACTMHVDLTDMGSIPGLGRSPGRGHDNPLQYSCLENPMQRGAWWIMVLQFSSVTRSCPTLCDPMNRSRPGLPVHHQLPEFTQTHVH